MTKETTQRLGHIQREVIAVLADLTSDWDLSYDGGIGPETRLIADLACESMDVAQFIFALGDRFGVKDLPFERLLMTDGWVEDLRVADIVAFLDTHLNEKARP